MNQKQFTTTTAAATTTTSPHQPKTTNNNQTQTKPKPSQTKPKPKTKTKPSQAKTKPPTNNQQPNQSTKTTKTKCCHPGAAREDPLPRELPAPLLPPRRRARTAAAGAQAAPGARVVARPEVKACNETHILFIEKSIPTSLDLL